VLAGGCDRLLTLTQRECVVDVVEYERRLNRFLRLMRERGLLPVYVVVLERQERGALHAHMAIRGYVPVVVVRALARRAGFDNIDVAYRRDVRGPRWRRVRLAHYLAKYVAKDPVRFSGGHRYRCSHGVEVPEERVEFGPWCGPEEVVQWFRARGHAVGYEWIDGTGRMGWLCSWQLTPAQASA